MSPPKECRPPCSSVTALNTVFAAMVSPTPMTQTMVEWPRANQNPTDTGRRPSFISFRVVLSIADMWSASKAWRIPRV